MSRLGKAYEAWKSSMEEKARFSADKEKYTSLIEEFEDVQKKYTALLEYNQGITQVKPCPFCGAPGRILRDGKGFVVGCSHMFCRIGAAAYSSNLSTALERWNDRAGEAGTDKVRG